MKSLEKIIEKSLTGLSFPSETDAPLRMVSVEDIGFDTFFSKLTKKETWHQPAEVLQAERFHQLEKVLRTNLTGLKITKIGTGTEFDYFIAGYDKTGQPVLIKTSAVET